LVLAFASDPKPCTACWHESQLQRCWSQLQALLVAAASAAYNPTLIVENIASGKKIINIPDSTAQARSTTHSAPLVVQLLP
jgi:hypothetical protein